MNNSKTNHLAVIVSAVVYFMIGGLWFGVVFGQAWLNAVGKSVAELQKTTMPEGVLYTLAFLTSLILCYTLNALLQRGGKQSVGEGVKLGLCLWIGIVATTAGPIFMFSGLSLRLFLLDTGYPLVAMIISGAIIGVWRKKPASQPVAKAAGA
jgi:surface polysaccharide O-acyltransferase-like enzyme